MWSPGSSSNRRSVQSVPCPIGALSNRCPVQSVPCPIGALWLVSERDGTACGKPPTPQPQRRPGSPHSKKQTPQPPNRPYESAFILTGSTPRSHCGRDPAAAGKLDTGHPTCPTGFAEARLEVTPRGSKTIPPPMPDSQVHPIARSKLPSRPTVHTNQLSISPEVPLGPILGATLLLPENSTLCKVTLLAPQALQGTTFRACGKRNKFGGADQLGMQDHHPASTGRTLGHPGPIRFSNLFAKCFFPASQAVVP